MTKLTASTVSRKLARAGLRPLPSGTPRSREGIRVSDSTYWVRVAIDIDSTRLAAEISAAVRSALLDAGYRVVATGNGFQVTVLESDEDVLASLGVGRRFLGR